MSALVGFEVFGGKVLGSLPTLAPSLSILFSFSYYLSLSVSLGGLRPFRPRLFCYSLPWELDIPFSLTILPFPYLLLARS